mmetsp:Transcript_13121/g.11000  ORF Transcript_13121/g.11000 Transcript_13121/m.11000 type:complete len:87 (+) Transcript_13121:41-301(+)
MFLRRGVRLNWTYFENPRRSTLSTRDGRKVTYRERLSVYGSMIGLTSVGMIVFVLLNPDELPMTRKVMKSLFPPKESRFEDGGGRY